MDERKLTENLIQSFHRYLIQEEKSTATVEKYLREVRAFAVYAAEKSVTKEVVMAYKKASPGGRLSLRAILLKPCVTKKSAPNTHPSCHFPKYGRSVLFWCAFYNVSIYVKKFMLFLDTSMLRVD